MPVLNTPTVSISLPVPTPVQQKPKAPQPQPVAQASAPPPTQAPSQYPVPLQPQVSAVILPWTPAPQRMQRRSLPKKVIKFSSAGSMDLTHMLQYVRENPYDTNVHGPLADAIDDIDFGNPVAKLIRRHYIEGQGNENLWYDNVYAGWDGTFPYTAKLGRHGPFKIYLGHERDSGSGNQRWVVHALSTLNGSRDLAYTFEIPHEEAHIIPQLFPAAAKHISPHRGPRKTVAPPGIPTEYTEDEWREREGSRFDWQMDEEHR